MTSQDLSIRPLLVTDSTYQDTLNCILNSIVFNRNPGVVSPLDIHSSSLNLTYPVIREADRIISEAISTLPIQTQIISQNSPISIKRTTLILSFYDVKRRDGIFGLLKEEKKCWESWNIEVIFMPNVSEQQVRDSIQAALKEIVFLSNKHIENLPEMTFTAHKSFSFEVKPSTTVQTRRNSWFNWGQRS